MSTPHERLKEARVSSGYDSASDAARAMGVGVSTYINHENGQAGITRQAQRYARFFRVSLDWLLTGKGKMEQPAQAPFRVTIDGLVGAGARVNDNRADFLEIVPDSIDLPELENVGALIVEGSSQWPRWQAGEVILYDRRPVLPDKMVDKYVVVQDLNGHRFVKILRRGKRPGTWRLDSHNAPPEEMELLSVCPYLGALANR